MASLLPIGTVIELADTEELMMIAGFAGVDDEEPTVVHDYIGFPYPLGFDSNVGTFNFDNTDISGIVAVGYQDSEAIKFVAKLESEIDSIKATYAAGEIDE